MMFVTALAMGGAGGPRVFASLLQSIPVDPDAPDARQLLRNELSKAPYHAAKPTWFDRASQAFLDWLGSLTAPTGEGAGPWLPLVLTLIILAALALAFIIFGLPRLNRRSRLSPAVFGEDDDRNADAMRRAAGAAAAAGSWSLACEEAFRAIARGLFERSIVRLSPGTTAHDCARHAAVAFPSEQSALARAADIFDRVRYLDVPGTEADYRTLTELDGVLRASRPAFADAQTASVGS